MYKCVIFDNYHCEEDLAKYLNSNNIKKDEILSISMSSDSNATERWLQSNINRILLVYDKT